MVAAREQAASRSLWHMQEALDRPVEMAREYPLSSMLVVFGVGIGVGLLLSQAIAGPIQSYLHQETLTERLGRQVRDALGSALPESLARQLPR